MMKDRTAPDVITRSRVRFFQSLAQAKRPEDVWAALTAWDGPKIELLKMVARASPVFDEGLLELLSKDWIAFSGLAENPHTDARVAAWAVRKLLFDDTCDLRPTLVLVLRSIIESRRVPWDSEAMQLLCDVATGRASPNTLMPNTSARLVIMHPDADPETLAEILRNPLFDERLAVLIFTHPKATDELRQEIITFYNDTAPLDSLQTLARCEAVRSDPKIVPWLLQQLYARNCFSDMDLIVRSGTLHAVDYLEQLARSLLDSNPISAIRVLAHWNDLLLERFTLSELQPVLRVVLSGADRERRLDAITLLGLLKDRDPSNIPSVETGAPRNACQAKNRRSCASD